MKSIVIIPFASRLHGESYISDILESFKKKLSSMGLKDAVYAKMITSIEDINESMQTYRDHIPLFFPITGGTERLMYTLATKVGFRSVVLFAHGEHNSLASAVSARYRLELEGANPYLYHCKSINEDECSVELNRMARALTTLSSLLGSRVLLIGPYSEKPEEAKAFEEVVEGSVDLMTIDEFASATASAPREYTEEFQRALEKFEFIVPPNRMEEVGKIYGTLRWLFELRKYDAIAMNCFPFLMKYKTTPCLALALLNAEGYVTACEGDLLALTLMIISKNITGYTGWIANSTAFKGKYAYFSHCTIALNMIKRGVITTHFESGYPYGIAGELAGIVYTFASISRDFTAIASGVGRVVRSGLLSHSMCRTQAIFELNYDAEKIPRLAMANHHVIIPGDVRRELREIATLLGLDYVDYGEIPY